MTPSFFTQIDGTVVIGGGHLALVGTMFYDNIVSLLVFAAIFVVLRNAAVLERGSLPAALGWAA